MKNIDQQLNWIDSGGGPLILLEQTALKDWQGSSLEQEPDDYDRACAVKDYIGLIKVGDREAIVLGDEPMTTAWFPSANQPGGIIVCWGCADSEADVIQALSAIPEEVWSDTGLSFQVGKTPLVLFDSAYPGENMEESLRINLEEGQYAISTAEYEPNEETSLILHRLELVVRGE